MSSRWTPGTLAEVYARMVRSQAKFVVVGGQAVNLWAERYQKDGAFPPEVWTDLLPFASRALDCLGSSLEAAKIAREFGVQADVYPSFGKVWTPLAADLRLPVGETELLVEFLHTVKGLKSADIEKRVRDLAWGETVIRVLHPAQCLECKLVNVCELDQERPPRQDLKDARLAALVLHAFVRERLAHGMVREALDVVEQIMRIAGSQYGLKIWYKHGLDVAEAVPLTTFRQAVNEEKVTNFLERRWSQLEASLKDRRDHFAYKEQVLGMQQHPSVSLLPLPKEVVLTSPYLVVEQQPETKTDEQGYSASI